MYPLQSTFLCFGTRVEECLLDRRLGEPIDVGQERLLDRLDDQTYVAQVMLTGKRLALALYIQ